MARNRAVRSSECGVRSGDRSIPHSAFRIPQSSSGFTLLEMMITVVVVGILAALAIPQYAKTIERSYGKEAQDLLLTIYTGERAYYLTNGMYSAPLTITSSMADWRAIFMDNPNLPSIPVAFSVSTTSSTFTATAARSGGPCGSWTRTINQDRGGTWNNPPPC